MGLAIVPIIIAAAGVVVTQTDLLDRLAGSASPTTPRWCDEIAALNGELSGNLSREFDAIVSNFPPSTTQLGEVGSYIFQEMNWERQNEAWSEIAAIVPPDIQPAAKRAADISAAMAQVTRDLEEFNQLWAYLPNIENAKERSDLRAQLELKGDTISGEFSAISDQITEGATDFERFDIAWRNTCPQSAVDS